MMSWAKIMMAKLFFHNSFIWRRPKVASFADIFKFLTMFMKTIFKKIKKFKELEIMH